MQGVYLDKQLVKIQESPNDIPEGETPLGVSAYTYTELVDVCRPGDRVAITGGCHACMRRALHSMHAWPGLAWQLQRCGAFHAHTARRN